MNELNGVNEGELGRMGQVWGLPHVAMLAKSPFRLGILSRHQMEVIVHETGPLFAHGLLCVHVLNTTICLTHLNPQDGKRRQMEARAIVSLTPPPPSTFMLLGDMNTLSPLDETFHNQQALADKILSGPNAGPLARKFLDSRKRKVNYAPMQELLKGGLRDVGEGGGETVPTLLVPDQMHFTKLRLDYCLVNVGMMQSCGGQHHRIRARTVRDRAVSTLSDHYPIHVEFEA
ncbi:MAG: hypothetical protein SGPRY_009315 [Prymnesium sp.]